MVYSSSSRRVLGRLFVAVLAGIFAGIAGGVSPAQAQVPDAETLIDRLETRYNDGTALRAQFSQTVLQNGQTRSLGGTLTLQGDRYRVETDGQTLVTDGETTWIYSPAKEQVVVNDYVEDETAFSPGRFFDGHRERYRATDVRAAQRDGGVHYVLSLAPRQEGAFLRDVTLWMRASDDVVTRLEVNDANGATMTFDLRDVTFGAETTAGTFRFDAPPSAKVVDLRS